MKRIFAKLSVALMMLSAIAIPFRSAGQTTEPDQTPPSGSPTSAPSQAPAPSPIPQPGAVGWQASLLETAGSQPAQ
jgi:hypothetical protein